MIDHLKTTLHQIRRAPYQAFAAIGICTTTFFLAGIFAILALGLSIVLRYFESKPQIVAFFKDQSTPVQIQELRAKLASHPQVASVKFVSKEDALAIYREENKNDPLLLEMVTANILPASIEVSSKDAISLTQIAEIIKSDPGVSEIIFQEDVISTLTKWTNSIRTIGIAIVIAFSLLTLVTILVIIGMRIATKKEEIETLYLIGATPGYIRAPFILEGITYGFVGALFSWIFTIISILYATPFLVTFLSGLPILPIPFWFYFAILGVEIAFGCTLGFFGSLFAVKRYFK